MTLLIPLWAFRLLLGCHQDRSYQGGRQREAVTSLSEPPGKEAAMRRWMGTLFAIILLPLSLSAEGFWARKDFTQWSPRECAKLLDNSPWAKSQTITEIFIEEIGDNPGSVPSREHAPQITYLAQIWSAEPIRQAVVRQVRLGPEFNRLSDPQRQALEAQQTALLEQKFPDHIVVRVEYSTTVPAYERALASYWQTRPRGAWEQDTFLSSSSVRRSPVDVQVTGGAGGYFVLVFARAVNGEPVIRPTDKSFTLELQCPPIEKLPGQRLLMEFKLKDMAFKGSPAF